MNRQERRAAAKQAGVKVAAGLEPGTPNSLHASGRQYLSAGQIAAAEESCRQALAIDGRHAGSLYLKGLISIHHGHYDEAIEWIAHAIREEPKVEFLAALGKLLQHRGRFEEALKVFDKAVGLSPEDAGLWKSLGSVLIGLQRNEEAVLSLQQALKLNPRFAEAANLLGHVHYENGQFQEALDRLSLSNDVQPNQADVLRTRALVFVKFERLEDALSDNMRSYELEPQNPDTSSNLGLVFLGLGRHDEALEWFDRALSLRPDMLPALTSKALTLTQLHRFAEAFDCYHRARSIDPNHALTEWNLALLQLLTGNFEDGWVGRESRWRTGLSMPYPKLPQPIWLGDGSVESKTILLFADEGIGDTIQFARYVPMLAARGTSVILAVDAALCPLLGGLPGVIACLPISASFSKFDLHCPMSSLPLAFGTTLETVPVAQSYISRPADALVQEWEHRFGTRDKPRVGFVWAGNSNHKNDRNRSISLNVFSRILDIDATFINLQKGPRTGDAAILAEHPEVIDCTQHLSDFVQTAAAISCLDLVITVDTSVAHLAGALGCPVWILLPYTPDYRWLLDREDTPWYPTGRLFRQTETREWLSVIERVRNELQSFVVSRSLQET